MSSIGTFGSFTQARLAIYASQVGLSVTGNNISNINTEGYTRQKLDQSSFYAGGADRYYSTSGVRVGNGVLCTGLSQLRDPYLDIRYRSQMSSVGYMDTKLGGLENIQSVLDEVGDGDDDFGILAAQFQSIYKALQNLSDQTGLTVYDTQVRAECTSLVKEFNAYASQLEEKYNDTVLSFNQDIVTINNILTNIRDLNATIRKSEIHGDNALELRDERNLLIDELSEYMKIDVVYSEEDIGAGQTVEKLTIRLGNANPDSAVESDSATLVDGIYCGQLGYTQVPVENPNFDPEKENSETNPQYLDANGDPTAKLEDAQMQDNSEFNLTVSELRDSHGRLLYTLTKGAKESLTPEEYAAAVKVAGGNSVAEAQEDGSTLITVYSQTGGKYYKQVYTRTPSTAVDLDDNDLYGALQATRELLTEAGEFATEDMIAADENAAGKRGIPYYQKALDLLANTFATAFNEANHGFLHDENGLYLDGADNPIETVTITNEDGTTETVAVTTATELTPELKQALEEAGAKELGFNLFSSRGDLDGTEDVTITASNISISSAWNEENQIIASFLKPTNLEVGSTDSSNIEHMIAMFTTKRDFLPGAVSPDSHNANSPMFNGTFEEMWDNIGEVLGSDMHVTSTLLDNYYDTSVELASSREGVSSVDLNDEAMNLMQYSKSYNAACRLMTTLDSVLEKLINGTGLTT